MMQLSDFPNIRRESVRYRDTDRQGHVNNAVFSTFFECSRTAILYDPQRKLVNAEREFVIVRAEIDYKAEIVWPGNVDIGLRIVSLGRSSIVSEQAIFQGEVLAAVAKTVMVMMDTKTRQSTALPASAKAAFGDIMLADLPA